MACVQPRGRATKAASTSSPSSMNGRAPSLILSSEATVVLSDRLADDPPTPCAGGSTTVTRREGRLFPALRHDAPSGGWLLTSRRARALHRAWTSF